MKLACAMGLGILLALSTACRDAVQPVPEPPAMTPPPMTWGFPALDKPGTVYVASEELAAKQTSQFDPFESRYVVYEDGSFAKQFFCCTWVFSELTGRYVRTGSLITFTFDDRGDGRHRAAEGVIGGDSLTVTYNLELTGVGFIGGVYLRASDAP
jgi:hypothetical protein